jgi:GntR family transcriptional repressor for pyruvate dehydrogenase complex
MNPPPKIPLAKELKSVRRVKVYEEISQQIEKLIHSGKLKPGDKLPTERELSEIFKVSRHSVREAIRVLEKSNLINSVAGSGTYVALQEHQEAANSIAAYLLEKTDELAEIFELRRIIEPQVAGLAASNATAADITQLKQLLEENEAFIVAGDPDPRILAQIDTRLHTMIAGAAHNSIIFKIIERLNNLFFETRQEGFQSPHRAKIAAKGHAEVIGAIIQGDAKRATKAMVRHLKDVEKTTIKHLVSLSLDR